MTWQFLFSPEYCPQQHHSGRSACCSLKDKGNGSKKKKKKNQKSIVRRALSAATEAAHMYTVSLQHFYHFRYSCIWTLNSHHSSTGRKPTWNDKSQRVKETKWEGGVCTFISLEMIPLFLCKTKWNLATEQMLHCVGESSEMSSQSSLLTWGYSIKLGN